MQRLALTGLLRIDLPDRDPVLLCDGGFFVWDGGTYRAKDPLLGTIASVEGLEEGRGDQIPALDLDFNPPGDAPIGDLSRPGYQQSRVRLWLAEFNIASGLIVGTPEAMFDGQIDQTSLRVGKSRTLSVSVVSSAERLFEFDIGNSFSSTFHKSVHPGEKGHDNASGLKVQIAWGVERPAGSGGGGGGRSRAVDGYQPRSLLVQY